MFCLRNKKINDFFSLLSGVLFSQRQLPEWERSDSVVQCLTRVEGPQVQASPRYVLEQEY